MTEKNIGADLDATQEMVQMHSLPTPATTIDLKVIIGFDTELLTEKLGL
ncbi:MAG: hypothetical protein M3305_13165 [Actinomycetota bacterium]|nr:hypothetical protein [Actinomycetota bacterium]